MASEKLKRTRTELAEFLRHHRERLTPADVGLPAGGRRRTRGLRREEVAALAGVGITWYTWFEQGREISVSETFLLSVARTLKLDDADCCHLFLLAHQRPPTSEAHLSFSVGSLVQRIMDDLILRPAYVMNLKWDVIAWNAAAESLFGFRQRLGTQRNMLHMIFADPHLRRKCPTWKDDAPKLLASFRRDFAVAPHDESVRTLAAEIELVSPDFRQWWRRHDVSGYALGFHTIDIAECGSVTFEHEIMTVDEHRHLRLVIYSAAVGETGSAAFETAMRTAKRPRLSRE